MKKYKNYFTLAFFLIGTLILLLYLLKWHAVYQERELNKPIISEHVKEIKLEEFDNYINENPSGVIYFGLTDNDYNREFETEFKDYIIEHHLQEAITYLNVNLIKKDFKKLIEAQYRKNDLGDKKSILIQAPALAIFKDAKLILFINRDNLKINNVSSILKQYEIIENNGYVND